jgi:hypothetical protein
MIKIRLFVAAVAILALSPLALAQAKNTQPIAEQVGQAQSGQPKKAVEASFTNLITAIKENNYDKFVSEGNSAFKEGITKQMFTQLSAQLAPRINKGYSIVFLGELKQQGYQVYLWKLKFKDGGDDSLARLSIKDRKVGGFFLN